MSKGRMTGLYLFAGGIILLIIYGLYLFIQKVELGGIDAIVAIGTGAIIIGVIVLIVSLIFEQSSDMKKRKEEIKKEDFEP